MNEALYEAILSRRSIKSYLPEQVPAEVLEKIITAGRYAPNGMNAMATTFIAVQKPEVIRKLSAMNAAVMGVDKDPFYGAQTVVLVLADKDRNTWLEDGSLAMGNMMLAAHSLGVDSCWIHRCRQMFESPEGQSLLREWGVTGNLAGVGCCILGYRATEPKPSVPRRENQVYYVK
jgi:nitroreductase